MLIHCIEVKKLLICEILENAAMEKVTTTLGLVVIGGN